MSSSLGEAVLDLVADPNPLKDQLDSSKGVVESSLGALGGVARGVLGVAMGVAATAVGAFTAALGISIKEGMDAQAVQAQLNAVLESTGGAAGVTAQMVNDLATSLSEVTRFSDDTITSGESMLLTFTGIGKDVFPAATQAMLDMSQAMGTDLKGTAIQLGKALNNPKEGLTALTRVGVTFTEEQKKLITSMQDAGDVAGAQKIILAELQEEFGGSAVAAGQTFAGQLDILKNKLLNVAEGIGTKLLPAGEKVLAVLSPLLMDLATRFAAFVSSPEFDAGLQNIINGLQVLVAWLQVNLPVAIQAASAFWTGTLQPAIATFWAWAQSTLIPFLGELWAWLQVNIPVALQTLSTFWTGTLQPAIATVWAWMQGSLFPTLSQLWDWLQTNIPIALQTLSNFWTGTLQPAIASVWAWMQGTLFPLLGELWNWLQTNIPAALQTLSNFWTGTLQPAIASVWGWINGTLIPLLSQLWTWLATNVPAALQTLSNFWTGTLLPAITSVWSWMDGTLFPFFKALKDFFDAAFTLALTALAGLWENVLLPAITKVYGFLNDNVKPIFEAIGAYLSDTFKPTLSSISDFVSGTLGPTLNGLATGALSAVKGAFDGISGAIQSVTDWLKTMADKLATLKLPDWLTPGSPTPFENGLRGISSALKDVANTQLPRLAANLQINPVGGAGPNGGAGNQTVNNWNLSVGTQRSLGNVMNDFAVMKVLAGA